MVLYLVLESTIEKTKTGQKIPQGIIDLKIDTSWIQWISGVHPDVIVILSNQTWIYSGTGIRNGERFWSKLKYISEVLREELEKVGQFPKIYQMFSRRIKWNSGLQPEEPSLIEKLWIDHPELKQMDSMFIGSSSDGQYAKKMGITKILTGI